MNSHDVAEFCHRSGADPWSAVAALHHGQYTTVPAETPIQGVKRVDLDALYDADQYRPSVREILGTPMFLY